MSHRQDLELMLDRLLGRGHAPTWAEIRNMRQQAQAEDDREMLGIMELEWYANGEVMTRWPT
jgi:hypothetical protein